MLTSRSGTVIEPDDMEKAILAFKESRDFNCDKFGVINMAVGKVSITLLCVGIADDIKKGL